MVVLVLLKQLKLTVNKSYLNSRLKEMTVIQCRGLSGLSVPASSIQPTDKQTDLNKAVVIGALNANKPLNCFWQSET